jgi:hypothetical protein
MNQLLVLVTTFAGGWLAQDAPPADPVLVEGPRPLRQSDVDAWRRLVEFAFGTALAPEQTASLQEELVRQWREADSPGRRQLAQAQEAWQQVDAARGARQEVLRLALRDELLAAARKTPEEPASRLVLELHDATNPVVVEGEPPLRRGSLDALATLLEWLVTQASGRPVEFTAGERAALRADVLRRYPRAAPGDCMLLAHLEETLALTQAEAEAASPELQARFRAGVARALGVTRPILTAPYVGSVETWEHPDGLYTVEYPADWPARYGALPEGAVSAGWTLLDVTVLGDAPTEALELSALPEAGALLICAVLPADVVADRVPLEEALAAVASALVAPSGQVEPTGEKASGQRALLGTWRQTSAAQAYDVLACVVLLTDPAGGAVLVLTRSPVERQAELGPAFSRVIHTLRLRGAASPVTENLGATNANAVLLDLANSPLGRQMDLVESLTGGLP